MSSVLIKHGHTLLVAILVFDPRETAYAGLVYTTYEVVLRSIDELWWSTQQPHVAWQEVLPPVQYIRHAAIESALRRE